MDILPIVGLVLPLAASPISVGIGVLALATNRGVAFLVGIAVGLARKRGAVESVTAHGSRE